VRTWKQYGERSKAIYCFHRSWGNGFIQQKINPIQFPEPGHAAVFPVPAGMTVGAKTIAFTEKVTHFVCHGIGLIDRA
jgi:hypothetical protein